MKCPKCQTENRKGTIRAAREIHGFIETQSPPIEKKIGQTLAMHTGITTGLVVTSKVEAGTEFLTGKDENAIPFIGSLYSLKYPEIKGVGADF